MKEQYVVLLCRISTVIPTLYYIICNNLYLLQILRLSLDIEKALNPFHAPIRWDFLDESALPFYLFLHLQ